MEIVWKTLRGYPHYFCIYAHFLLSYAHFWDCLRRWTNGTILIPTNCVTANITEPGTKFEKVPDVIGIYISKFDMFKSGKTVYHIDRVIRETGEVQDNGLQEIYVNTRIDDGSDIAELMRIFKENDAYDFEKFPKVSGRKKQFKESEGGDGTM